MTRKKCEILIGTSGWSYKGWATDFYPEDVKVKDRFHYYSQHFPIVEINATFYRLFDENTFIKWRKMAPRNFHYVVKVPRIITHRKKLLNCKEEIKEFCMLTSILQNKLRLMLLQLPPSMPYDLARLERALLQFDQPKKVVVEFRNKAWLTADTKALLQKLGVIFCITDSPIIKLSNWLTADIGYIRLHGHTHWFDYNYSKKELTHVIKITEDLIKQGAKKIYILFNNDIHAYAPKNALEIAEML